jgi:hypothetical protein
VPGEENDRLSAALAQETLLRESYGNSNKALLDDVKTKIVFLS